MATKLEVDSGILQFTPKGAYYEEANEQFKKVYEMWKGLFKFDRTMFCLTMLLQGTGFSKGMMTHMLLSNPQSKKGTELVPLGLPFDYEQKVILFNLAKERTPRALKNLLLLAGSEKQKRINNNRTRKIILDFIFKRDNKDLDYLAINYKQKLRALIKHALGKYDLKKLLDGDRKVFDKFIGKRNVDAFPVICHIFDKDVSKYKSFGDPKSLHLMFQKINQYGKLKEAAQKQDVEKFRTLMKGMPMRTAMGFRNLYKVAIDKAELFEKADMSERETIQMEAAMKKSGAKKEINYEKQEIYDLWKAFYYKVITKDNTNLDKISKAIDNQSKVVPKLNIGECVVVIDASESMAGSEQRPLHPFLTSLCIISAIDNIKDIIYVGGQQLKVQELEGMNLVLPKNHSPLWKGLVEAVITGAKNIIVISDGYENAMKGMFNHTYKYFKDSGYDFNLIHLNPVMATDAKTGTSRKLVEDVKPLPVADYKYLETELIFNRMIEQRELVKQLLVGKYNALIGEKEEKQ